MDFEELGWPADDAQGGTLSLQGPSSRDVAKKVYLLWFVQESKEQGDIELLIGVYETEAAAEAAISRIKNKPGFVDFPEGFQIHPRKLEEDDWTEGFIRD